MNPLRQMLHQQIAQALGCVAELRSSGVMTLVKAPPRRKLAIILGTLIVLLVGALAFEQWFAARSFQERHRKWLKEQRPVYDQMATKVMAQKATLTSEPR